MARSRWPGPGGPWPGPGGPWPGPGGPVPVARSGGRVSVARSRWPGPGGPVLVARSRWPGPGPALRALCPRARAKKDLFCAVEVLNEMAGGVIPLDEITSLH